MNMNCVRILLLVDLHKITTHAEEWGDHNRVKTPIYV